jgi:2'-5' RNA ligase
MRLFIAVLFDQDIKDALYDTVTRLKQASKGGTFTDKENLHLTINFIGETKRLEEVKEAMLTALERVSAESFTLSIGGFGRFKRDEGDIYWIGVEKDNMLWRIQKELAKELKNAGFFDIDDREYKPHLTLGRRIKVDEAFDRSAFEAGIEPLQMIVGRISLMKSERVEGKLTYTEIFQLGLK